MIFAETERLLLRRARADDLEPLLESWADPEMVRYTEPKADPRGFLRDMIADMQGKTPGSPGWYQYIVERRSDGMLIGDLGAGFDIPGERQVELGYRVRLAFHHQGYAREAVAGLIGHLADVHSIHRFVAVAASANVSSLATLRSLGSGRKGISGRAFSARVSGSTTIISPCSPPNGASFRQREREARRSP